MKLYTINNLQGCNFMDDTYDEPMTANVLRARFWVLDECRTKKYSQFTKEHIYDMWKVEFEETIYQCGSCEKVFEKLEIYKSCKQCPYCHSGNWVRGYIDE